ncbi:MAG TPA: sugar phosphate nucleotidyltransferase [Sideroxyarcus sp.]|nr:sugar phosphate nucleotidyltransferase [Sideroxyarcus sp.]
MTFKKSDIPGCAGEVLTFVLAGGEGTRLRPLTHSQAKPALPFGSGLRLVDFVLSNLVNSELDSIYLLAQYKPESLIEHIRSNWQPARQDVDRFVRVVLPQREHGGKFLGTADAVYQNLALIERHAPRMVAVFAADHIYRMDVRQMVQFHRENDADVTIAATQVPIELATSFGIIAAGHQGEIWDFQEKPDMPAAIPSNPGFAYASMGNYLFDTGVLVTALEQAARCGETDFGRHVLPRLIRSHRAHAYDFSDNCIPGVQPHEEPAYWRDVGTLDAYMDAHLDVAGNAPRFNLHNPHWPIRSARPARSPATGQSHPHLARKLRGSSRSINANGALSA